MKNILYIFILSFLIAGFSNAASLGSELSGMILLNVEENGEAWYVYPEDHKRYFLGRPADAFEIMRELGLGINERNFQRLAQAGMEVEGDLDLAKRLSGKIIIQTEKNGEAWYIYPKDLKKYYLGRPADAFRIMRELSLGITRDNLARVHKPGLIESIDAYSKYEHRSISTGSGSFTVDLVEIDLSAPFLEIITDASVPYPAPDRDKSSDYHGSNTLGEFVVKHDGFAGINATYFCSSSGCGAQNYYFYPIYKSSTGEFVNKNELKYWTTGPIIAFDENNNFYYFKDSREFESVENFEKNFGKLQAALGNKPRLIEDGKNLLIEWDIDEKQRNVKSNRNALAYKENKIYLVIVRNATVPELADIMQALKMEYAVNLDGGYSSALWYNDEYMVGPGREIPNAIIFVR